MYVKHLKKNQTQKEPYTLILTIPLSIDVCFLPLVGPLAREG